MGLSYMEMGKVGKALELRLKGAGLGPSFMEPRPRPLTKSPVAGGLNNYGS